ncbi:prepilin-type N-terminal cleavage/methylation domain-containing protein [bacterium]|nr:prepilin-type N-terminal cleavage/methylation domain-containing protein [bacterium]
MRKRGFSLIELLIVFLLLALLAGLGAGAYARYRNNLSMVQSSQRLATELVNAQQQARTSGQVQMRAGVELSAAPLAAAPVVNQRGTLECRIYEGSTLGIRNVKKFYVLDDTLYVLTINATNVPNVPLVVGDTGLVMEVGITQGAVGVFQRLFTIPFNPDGTVALPLDTEPARIIVDNGIYRRQVEISRVGKVTESRL